MPVLFHRIELNVCAYVQIVVNEAMEEGEVLKMELVRDSAMETCS
jgi:hypothetical protein